MAEEASSTERRKIGVPYSSIEGSILRGIDKTLAYFQLKNSYNRIKDELPKVDAMINSLIRLSPANIVNNAVNRMLEVLYLQYKGEQDATEWCVLAPTKADIIADEWYRVSQLYGGATWERIYFGMHYRMAEEKAKRYYLRLWTPYLPDDMDLFIMWRKGLISEPQFKDYLLEVTGLDRSLQNAYIQHLYYDMSFYDLYRLSDLIPLPTSWVEKKLRALGLNDEDLSLVLPSFYRRPLRDEITKLSSVLYEEYAKGHLSETEFQSLLRDYSISEEEIRLKTTIANRLRDKYILGLREEAEIYLFRRGIIPTPDQLYERLMAIGIQEPVAQAITRLEAAKMGIEWVAPE